MNREIYENGKKILIVMVSGVVIYLAFRLLLPLVFPFAMAFLAAMLIRPLVCWLRLRLHLKESLGAGLVLILCGIALMLVLYYGGGLLLRELKGILEQFQSWNTAQMQQRLVEKLTGGRSEKWIILGVDVVQLIPDLIGKFSEYFTWERCIDYGMSKSGDLMQGCIRFFTGFVVFFMASILAVEEMEQLHSRLTGWIFYREIVDFGLFLRKVCGKWLRVQGLILLFVTMISCLGLWAGGFSYALLLGIVIGLVDMLPILGSGTLYLPWMLWQFVTGHVGKGIWLLVLYLLCYFTRELLESRIMGKSMGITAFEFLAAVYVGLKLFGAAGFILGPLGVLIILWMVSEKPVEGTVVSK